MIQDPLVLKETEDYQVFRGHLVHRVLQELEVQDLPVHKDCLENEEKRVMRDSLESHFLDHPGDPDQQDHKEYKDHLAPQDHSTVM